MHIKKLGRKIKEPDQVHIIAKLANITMGLAYIEKYFDLGSP